MPSLGQWLALARCSLGYAGAGGSLQARPERIGLPEEIVKALAVMPLNGPSRHRLS